MPARLTFSLIFSLGALVACGSNAVPPSPSPEAGTGIVGSLAGRTYILKVPRGYDGSRPLPLIVSLHGYGFFDGAAQEAYFGMDPVADERGFFVVYPDGTVDPSGRRFFNATDACCDFYATGVDDVAFIGSLIDHLESSYAIDPARVYAVGHSNGGFMSYRLACDLSPRIAAVVSLEGAMWNDPSRCHPTEPVAILEVHGTDDAVILPAGGDVVDGYPDRVYPSTAQTMADWALLDACAQTTRPGPDPGDIDSATSLPTTATLWNDCRASEVELWMIQGGVHGPALTSEWPEAVVDFLLAHAKPGPDVVATH